MALNIHTNIKEKLEYFHSIHKIPNILFHGPSGTGKRTIVNNFINLIYDGNKNKIKDFVMYVNCAHGKGIKFIREELKFFAKTHINSNGGDIFKSIIMLNADKLTTDAQSAMRRCIELFSHNTRFFIIVEDKYKLLKPILSRFCELYIPEPIYNGKPINLYKYNIDETFKSKTITTQYYDWLKKTLIKETTLSSSINTESDANTALYNKLIDLSVKLYEKSYSALDIIVLLENNSFLPELNIEKRYELLVTFNKIKKEFRNEKMLIMFVLNFIFISSDVTLENISFM
jgi:DNA polymerase III delta prime subunit